MEKRDEIYQGMKARKGSRQGGISNLSLGNLSLGFDQQIGFL